MSQVSQTFQKDAAPFRPTCAAYTITYVVSLHIEGSNLTLSLTASSGLQGFFDHGATKVMKTPT